MTAGAIDPVLGLALRGAFAFLFAAAASHKLRDLARFRAIVAAYEILPPLAVAAAAPLLAVAEAALAAGLAADFQRPALGLAAASLLLAYAAAIHVNILRGRSDIDCGCMGPASRLPLGRGLVARNFLLAITALFLLLPVDGRALGWPDLATAAAALAVLATCWSATERLLLLAPRVAALRSRRRPR